MASPISCNEAYERAQAIIPQSCLNHMTAPYVSIVILNWNGKDMLQECLRSASNLEYPNYNIVVVDNGSTDGSQDVVRHNFPEAHLIENEQNLGFAEGQNTGIRYAMRSGADFIFILNNDITLDRNVLTELVAAFEDDASIGIAGPILYHADRPTVVQKAGAMISWSTGRTPYLGAKAIGGALSLKTIPVDSVGMFLAKAALFERIGFFDARLFSYWEDTDLCLRAKKAGCRVVCVPAAKIWHNEGSTAAKVPGLRTYYLTRNRFWMERKYASWGARVLFYLVFFLGIFWFNGVRFLLVERNGEAFRALLKGTRDGVFQDS
jgi:GT2 family glycosyltransferase